MNTLPPLNTGDSGVQKSLLRKFRPKDMWNGFVQFFVGLMPTYLKNRYVIRLPAPIALTMAIVTGVVKMGFGLYEIRGKEFVEARLLRFEQRYIAVGFAYGCLQGTIFFTFMSIAATLIWHETWGEIAVQAGRTYLVNFLLGYPILLLTEWAGRQLNWLIVFLRPYVEPIIAPVVARFSALFSPLMDSMKAFVKCS